MNNEHLYQETAIDEQGDNFNGLKYFLSRCLYHWPLFVVSILITTGIAYYKLRSEKPSYEAGAKLLVNAAKETSESSALQK